MPQNKVGLAVIGFSLFFLLGISSLFADEISTGVPTPPETTLGSSLAFHPFWTATLTGIYGAEDGGQRGGLFSFTGHDHLNPQGSFFEAGAFGGSRIMEKNESDFGGIQMGGGFGLGDLTPSLLIQLEQGDSEEKAIRVIIGVDKQLAPTVDLNFFLTAEVTSHDGPLGAFVGLPAGSAAEIDDLNTWGGAALKLAVFSPLDLTFTLRGESDETVKIQDPTHTQFNEVDCAEYLTSLSLKADWTLTRHWSLSAGGEGGMDTTPAGTFYSKRLGETLTQSHSQTLGYFGFSLGFTYLF